MARIVSTNFGAVKDYLMVSRGTLEIIWLVVTNFSSRARITGENEHLRTKYMIYIYVYLLF